MRWRRRSKTLQPIPQLKPDNAIEPVIMVEGVIVEQQQAESLNSPLSTNNNGNTSGTGRQLAGAAVAGGIAGLLLAGPLVAAVAATGAVLAATSQGKAGAVARATGETMAGAGDTLRKINQEHRVVEKTGKGVAKGCKWVGKQLNNSGAGKLIKLGVETAAETAVIETIASQNE
jgi:hypothetical protein